MNQTLAVNVSLLTVAIGAITNGLNVVYAHDYLAGGISIVAGIILLVVYHLYPPAASDTTQIPVQAPVVPTPPTTPAV